MPEIDIRAALEATVAAGERTPQQGPADVFAGAARLRRRRTGTSVLAAVAVLGVSVAAGGLAAARGWPAVGPAQQPAATATAASSVAPAAVTEPGRVLAVLRDLAPDGLRPSAGLSQRGWARVTLTDAAGSGAVEVNVQPGFAGPAAGLKGGGSKGNGLLDRFDCRKRSDPDGTACTDARRPDGTRVVTTDGPGDEPGVAGLLKRSADTLAPDGTRVVVSVWNAAPDPADGVTRPEPPLSVAQVRDLALSPSWRERTGQVPPPDSGGAGN